MDSGKLALDRPCDADEANRDLVVGVPLQLPGRHVLQGGVAELFHQPLILFGELRREFGGRFIATERLEPFRGQLGQTFALRKISM